MHLMRFSKNKNYRFGERGFFYSGLRNSSRHYCYQYIQTRCSAIAERLRCRVRYSFRQK